MKKSRVPPEGKVIRDACLSVYAEMSADARGLRPNIRASDFRKPQKYMWLVECRWLCWHLSRQRFGTSYPALARFGGVKNHGTVVHGIAQIINLIEVDKKVRQRLERVQALLDCPMCGCPGKERPCGCDQDEREPLKWTNTTTTGDVKTPRTDSQSVGNVMGAAI